MVLAAFSNIVLSMASGVGLSIEDALEVEKSVCLEDYSDNPSVVIDTSLSEVVLTKECDENYDYITLDQIAVLLLKDKLLLTALELHTELLEVGKELPRLKDFFSNPGNFEKQGLYDTSPILPRTSSIQTFDSLDFTRYSDDADRQLDERVAVLEFELRKAKDTIKALRANLTVVTESDPNSPINISYKSAPEASLKPHEKRALNFLVNEYLLKNNYKLSSITFADENEDQDFDDWDDVGLNIPQPPELLLLYRNYCKHSGISNLPCCDTECQTDTKEVPEHSVSEMLLSIQLQDELVTMRDKLHYEQMENERLLKLISRTESDMEAETHAKEVVLAQVLNFKEENISPEKLSVVGDNFQSCDSQDLLVGTGGDLQARSLRVPHVNSGKDNVLEESIHKSRHMSQPFQDVLLVNSRLQKLGNEESYLMSALNDVMNSESNVVFLLAKCLPNIVPNILLAKREELIPLILCAIILHPHAKERDKLLNILFNLIKRPDEDQRHMILTGFVAVAQHLGPEKVEAELLPQCWEQIAHKYPERRILVAESCGVLTPFIPNSIRSSLVLSILQQMLLEEKEDEVRESAVRSLAVLLAFLEDNGKFSQALSLLLKVLNDDSQRVADVALNLLLPSISCWALEIDCLESHVFHALLHSIQEQISSENTGKTTISSAKEENVLVFHLRALHNSYPFLLVSILKSSPYTQQLQSTNDLDVDRFPTFHSELIDPVVILGDHNELAQFISWFDKYVSEEWYKSWDSLEWICKTFLPSILKLLLLIDPSNQPIVHAFTEGINFFCRLFGKSFVWNKVKPVFAFAIENPKSSNFEQKSAYESAVVPIYAAGVLATFYQEENQKALESFLEDTLYALGLNQTTFETVKSTFCELGNHINRHELLLTVLWKGVVHVSAVVRSVSGRLFEQLVCTVNEHLLRTRIVPALITLASDPDIDVRASTVPSFGAIMEFCTQKDLLDKVHLQLQTFLDDPLCKDQQALLLVIIQTFAKVGPNTEPKFRDEFVLPRLAVLAAHNNHTTSEAKRSDVANALLEAYTALSCCFLRDQIIAESLLPGLRCLLRDTQAVAIYQTESVVTMIQDFEAKLDANRTVDSSQALGLASAQTSMEDMKNRVTKIFTNRPAGGRPSIPNIFQLRKKP